MLLLSGINHTPGSQRLHEVKDNLLLEPLKDRSKFGSSSMLLTQKTRVPYSAFMFMFMFMFMFLRMRLRRNQTPKVIVNGQSV